MRKTKIVATIGPASESEETLEQLIEAGVNVFRFNMKHGTVEWHEERIKRVQSIADKLNKRIGILIDLQGPEIRISTPNKMPIEVQKGEEILFCKTDVPDPKYVVVPHQIVFDVLEIGDTILIDDGFLEFSVVNKTSNSLMAKALDNYTVENHKGMNLPGKEIDLPSLIHSDLLKLDMATKSKVDFVALSFSRTRRDIETLREEMEKRGLDAQVIAKIESKQAIDNIDDLIEASDGIMVARGDLGVEVPIEQLAYLQELIVQKCRESKRPVIVATQMLQSMINAPRPTRAEATDVANAVFDGTDAIMLSGETASGNYPVKAVEAMAKIARFNEGKSSRKEFEMPITNNTEFIVEAAMEILDKAEVLEIKKIIVFTQTGFTAKAMSSYRLPVEIIAVTNDSKIVEYLTLSYGVRGFKTDFPTGEFKISEEILKELISNKILTKGETVLIIHGQHWQRPGLTNALVLHEV